MLGAISRRPAELFRALALPACVTAVFGACATPEPKEFIIGGNGSDAPGSQEPVSDLAPREACQVKAEIEDAISRLRLAEQRARYETDEEGGRAARFGALLSIQNDQERFRAFHADGDANPQSVIAPLGECFVYAGWKMADLAAGRCGDAEKRLQNGAIVDVARAELLRRTGMLDEAKRVVDKAVAADVKCVAAVIEQARVNQARGELDAAVASWESARFAWPQCYLCAVEAAKIVEAGKGKQAAVPLWEAALAIQPDSADALKRYGATLAGVDNARALQAYERAVAAGQTDVPTLMAAANLAVTMGGAGAVDKAIVFADRVVAVQPNNLDGWRLVLSLAQQKKDAKRTVTAATEVLRLAGEDLPALLALGRQAHATAQFVEAVLRFDLAARAIAGGRTAGLSAAEVTAAERELSSFRKELKIAEKPASGGANRVIAAVQGTVQGLYVERLESAARDKRAKPGGTIEVSVTVTAAGTVDEVEIVKDTLGDPALTASVVGNLRRAQVSGGAKRYSFGMDFR